MRRAGRREKARVFSDPVVGRIVNHSTVLFAMNPAFGLLKMQRDGKTFDFFTVPTIRFQVLYVFLVLAHDGRRILHFNPASSAGVGQREGLTQLLSCPFRLSRRR